MANLWITEYARVGLGDGTYRDGSVQMPLEPAETGQNVSFTTATQSAAFGSSTYFVRLVPSANCHVLFGANPTADADDQRLTAGEEYFRAVAPGDKLSVYDGSS